LEAGSFVPAMKNMKALVTRQRKYRDERSGAMKHRQNIPNHFQCKVVLAA
jgi:hypothetical protein